MLRLRTILVGVLLCGTSGYSLADWDLWISSTWGDPLGELFDYHNGFDLHVGVYTFPPRPWVGGTGRIIQPRTVPRVPVDVVPPPVTDLEPPGRCSVGEHRRLQDIVHAECRDVGRRACTTHDSCPTLYAKLDQNVACYNARQTINNRCFEGGDPGHRAAAEDALRAQNNCWTELVRKRCEV